MNIALKVEPGSAAISVAHSVMAYDRSTDQLVSELAIPLFLDPLALRIAEVPPDDVFGAVSYPLKARHVEAFGFLLGLEPELQARDYFIEATPGSASDFSPAMIEAVAALSAAMPTPPPNVRRAERISEGELVVPILRLLEADGTGWMDVTELARRLSELFPPSDPSAEVSATQPDALLSQRVRDVISHRHHDASFIKQGLAEYDSAGHGLRISERGRSLIRALRSR